MVTKEKTYDVAIEFHANNKVVDSVIKKFGLKDVEVAPLAGGTFKVKVKSGCSEYEPLENHVKSLVEMFRGITFSMDDVSHEVWLIVGVFYHSATCTIFLDAGNLSNLVKIFPGLIFSATCYPCKEETTEQQKRY